MHTATPLYSKPYTKTMGGGGERVCGGGESGCDEGDGGEGGGGKGGGGEGDGATTMSAA